MQAKPRGGGWGGSSEITRGAFGGRPRFFEELAWETPRAEEGCTCVAWGEGDSRDWTAWEPDGEDRRLRCGLEEDTRG